MTDLKKLTPEDKELLLEKLNRCLPNLKVSTVLFEVQPEVKLSKVDRSSVGRRWDAWEGEMRTSCCCLSSLHPNKIVETFNLGGLPLPGEKGTRMIGCLATPGTT
jgi:hypothetical protein